MPTIYINHYQCRIVTEYITYILLKIGKLAHQRYRCLAVFDYRAAFGFTLASGSESGQDIVNSYYDGCTDRRDLDRSRRLSRTNEPSISWVAILSATLLLKWLYTIAGKQTEHDAIAA